MEFLLSKCTFRPYSEELISKSEPFICDDEDLNDFFANDCLDYSKNLFGKTYCFTLNEAPKKIVCAFTVSNDSIKPLILPKPVKNKLGRKIPNAKRSLKSFPAVLIGRLGVAKEFEGKGIGRELMDFIKAWFIEINNKTGCRYVVVDAYNKKRPLAYYEKNGFKFLFPDEEHEKEYTGIQTDEPLHSRLMYFDLIMLRG